MKLFKNPVFQSRITTARVNKKELLLGYFIGPFLALISNTLFGSYLNQYFNNVLGMTAYHYDFAVLMPIVSVIFVIFGNLFVGRLIDNTHTSEGKARPYFLVSLPLIAIAIILLFTGPLENSPFQLIWIAVSYNIYFAIAYPFYYNAHSSMVSLSTRNIKERGLLATLSNASAIAAIVLGVTILFPLFQGYLFIQDEEGAINRLASYEAWRWFMIALVVITLIGIILEYLYTRERITEENLKLNLKIGKVPMKKQIKAVTSSKDWWILIIFFLLLQFGGLVKNGAMGYYCYAMFGVETVEQAGHYQSLLGILGGLPLILGIFIAWPIARKFGKRKAMMFGLVFAVLGGLISLIDVHNFIVVAIGIILRAIGGIPALFVSLALLSDVLDHLEAKNGFRSDGFTMAVYGSVMIGLVGVGGAVVNAILGKAGFDFQNLTIQSETAKSAVTWTYLIIELICYALMAVLLTFTKVEEHVEEDQKKILDAQKAKVLAEGGVWVDPKDRLELEQEEAQEHRRKK